MSEFRVWAPKPEQVRLDLDGTDGAVHAMRRSDDGWWHATVDTPPNAHYGYLLDDDPSVLPDPRSARQPDGVHGRSQLWDAGNNTWTDAGWTGRSVEGAVIYELHIGTFTPAGTFDSAVEKLDYLVDLGIDFVELMPVNSFSGTHGWGYDGVLWYSVHEPYGGPDGLVRFVDACHARGLGVLIDAVFNHLGPSGNYLPRFGPYLSSASNPWGEGINIADADSDEVRRYIIGCALRWMRDFHADGLRLDAVHALVDTTAVHILEELATETDWLSTQLGRPLSLIAESDLNDPRLITPRDRGGYGLTAQWDDDIHHAIHTAVSGERQGYYADFGSLATLTQTLRHGFFHAGTYSSFRRRRHGQAVGHRRGSRPPNCLPTPAPMIRSAIAPSGIAPRRTSPGGNWRSKPRLPLDHPTLQCFSWARNGGRRLRSNSSARTPSRSWPAPPPRDAKPSSPSTAGTPTTSPTRRIRKPSSAPS